MLIEDFVLKLRKALDAKLEDLHTQLYTAEEGDNSARVRGQIAATISTRDMVEQMASDAHIELEGAA